MEIEQVYYSDWSSTLKPEHKNYWSDISNIANIISFMLEGYSSLYYINTSNIEEKKYFECDKLSCISVQQAKEKFGEIRVYCTLADENLVEIKYYKHCINNKNNKNISLEEFREKMLVNDIKHYRDTYFSIKSLHPHYWRAISGAADYSYYLVETPEKYLELCAKEQLKEKNHYKYYSEKKNLVFSVIWPEYIVQK